MRLARLLAWLLLLPVAAVVALLVYLHVPVSDAELRGERLRTTRVLDRDGVVLREVRSSRHGVSHWTALERMDPWVRQAVVAAEDKRFYRHPGLDPAALLRAAVLNVRAGRIVSGGSTITQQLVRNMRAYPDRGIGTKLVEALEALRLERCFSKERILEAYLNRVGFGNGTYGVEAAARLYFGRDPGELSLAQASLLAAIPRAPAYYEPFRHRARTGRRQRYVLDRMRALGFTTESEHASALAESVALRPWRAGFRAPHFVDVVLNRTDVPGGRPEKLRTTLDWRVQQFCEELLSSQLDRLRSNHATNGAAVVLDRATGEVLAMVGSRDYFDPDAGQVNACLSPRQNGSAVKPFAYATAFDLGMTPSAILPDLPHYFLEQGGDYRPVNYDRGFHGPVSARRALACSYNVPAVYVTADVGPDRLLDRLRRAGLRSLTKDAEHYGLALGLGVGDVPLLELANGYRTLANGGAFSEVRFLRDACDDGAEREPVFSPQACFLVEDILTDNVSRAPAFGEFSALCLPFRCAVKTGTSKDFRDNWTVGYTADHVVGVWIGNFDGTPMHRVSGVSGAAPLFRDIMLMLHPEGCDRLPEPDGIVRRSVCPKSGKLPGPWCPNTVVEVFREGTVPRDTCRVHRLLRVDERTDRVATAGSRGPHVRERVVEVYPPEYWAWMEQRGMPLYLSPDSGGTVAGAGLQVLFPDHGDVFKVDPDVADADQAIRLQASVPAGTSGATWVLDGCELGSVGPPFTLFWGLEPGRHRVRVEAGTRASEEVSFLVLP